MNNHRNEAEIYKIMMQIRSVKEMKFGTNKAQKFGAYPETYFCAY